MARIRALAAALAVLLAISASQAAAAHPEAPRRAVLLQGLGNVHHPIATRSPRAQRFFDQGFALLFAFNHEEAERSFRTAAELDPKAPMPWWGIAYALGPNINMDVDPARERAAWEASRKALALSQGSPGPERAYVEALATRYSNDPKADLKQLAAAYKDAMARLVKRYPDDLDAAVLYAESLMDLRPWKLWTKDGKPEAGTAELVSTLESVLRRDPEHVGANHFYIHAVEASPHPEWALPSAQRLPGLAPGAGHLVHMPAHIYVRTGDYAGAARANAQAARVDEATFRHTGACGMYPFMYYGHNLHFLAYAESMRGRYADARRAADRVAALMGAHAAEMPGTGDYVLMTPALVDARFGRWDRILRAPAPDAKLQVATALSHFTRGIAYAGKKDAARAEAERAALDAIVKQLPAGTIIGLNRAGDVLGVARAELEARIAAARGDRKAAVAAWERAVAAQDALSYNEPPDWFRPMRESLGAALLLDGQAERAERVFRDDLVPHPRSGRSLFGLERSLESQKRDEGAAEVRPLFERAWRDADVRLRLEDL